LSYEEDVKELEKKIAEVDDLDISILINNVGYFHLGPLHEQSVEEIFR